MHQLVPFFKFFLEPKNDFLHPSKTCDHYALVFLPLLHKIFFVIFRFDLHKSRKNFEKMDKNRCPKMRSTKYFWENSTRARCFAELFGTHARQTINALANFKNKNGQKSSSNQNAHLRVKMPEFGALMCSKRANVFSRKRFCRIRDIRRKVFTETGALMCPKRANVFSRKRFCRIRDMVVWCLFLSWQHSA